MSGFVPGLEGVVARTAGRAARTLEQKLAGGLVRPGAVCAGPAARPVRDVPGAAEVAGQHA